jgi:hypothetical protein
MVLPLLDINNARSKEETMKITPPEVLDRPFVYGLALISERASFIACCKVLISWHLPFPFTIKSKRHHSLSRPPSVRQQTENSDIEVLSFP